MTNDLFMQTMRDKEKWPRFPLGFHKISHDTIKYHTIYHFLTQNLISGNFLYNIFRLIIYNL